MTEKTDLDLVYESILADPASDLLRLEYADLLDREGNENDQLHAEFIRVQLELSQLCNSWELDNLDPISIFTAPDKQVGRIREMNALHARQLDLWHTGDPAKWYFERLKGFSCRRNGPYGRHRMLELMPSGLAEVWRLTISGGVSVHFPRRGFPDSLVTDWPVWNFIHPYIYWHPDQTMKCPNCIDGVCNDMDIGDITFNEWPCSLCGGNVEEGIRGTGMVRRPPTTKQLRLIVGAEEHATPTKRMLPITAVDLTDDRISDLPTVDSKFTELTKNVPDHMRHFKRKDDAWPTIVFRRLKTWQSGADEARHDRFR